MVAAVTESGCHPSNARPFGTSRQADSVGVIQHSPPSSPFPPTTNTSNAKLSFVMSAMSYTYTSLDVSSLLPWRAVS